MLNNNEYIKEKFSDTIIEDREISKKKFLNCNFSGCDLTDVEIVYGCIFDSCNFSSAKLNGVKFQNCAFLNCRMNYCDFFATIFEECKMTGSMFANSDCNLMKIEGGDWSFCTLRYLTFQKQTFNNMRFCESDLTGTAFEKCTLKECDFNGAIVENLSFRDCDIRTCDINGIDVRVVDFKGSKLDLQQCVIIAEQLTEGKFEME